MSAGFHYLGANAGKVPGYSNRGRVNIPMVAIPAASVKAPPPAVDATLLDSERVAAPAMGKAQAVQSGYTGDQCSHCSSMRMKISGHCQVCEDCGTTTGCS
jgi:ribonucleoside-diphosphate reductase alpha chain